MAMRIEKCTFFEIHDFEDNSYIFILKQQFKRIGCAKARSK